MRQVSPKLQPWLDAFNKQIQQLIDSGFKSTPTNAREGLANLTKALVTTAPDIAWIQDDLVTGTEFDVPVRIYHSDPESSLPVLIYYHGGGHMAGSITVYDPICRKLANATQHIVVSVDYRLAPECPYPSGVNDAYTVLQNIWTTLNNRNIPYQKTISIAGDSGGGALVATVSQRAQNDKTVNINKQVMIYPSLDYTMNSASIEQNAKGYLLEKSKIEWYFENYFQHGEDPLLTSPLYCEFTDNLPKTLLFTAEFCPLRDEGIAYCDKAKQAGVSVQHVHFSDMIHAFLNMEDLVKEECDSVYQTIANFLNQH